jgi:hypothetical protein
MRNHIHQFTTTAAERHECGMPHALQIVAVALRLRTLLYPLHAVLQQPVGFHIENDSMNFTERFVYSRQHEHNEALGFKSLKIRKKVRASPMCLECGGCHHETFRKMDSSGRRRMQLR